ncbi:MAG: high frequency lysogenization protein HflD, partial [Arthrospira sp. SH-MAG29]|nr:high frequency lysogenization protein HflD [Arthrospira sp. SH-MAG29]
MTAHLIFAHLNHSADLVNLLTSDPNLTTIGLGVAIAFGLGGIHALSPGHGKTLVSAYLIGSKGTPQQAILLGVTTTATHTLSVFVLGAIA